jgi:anti-sigma B factor antagonist
LDPSNTVLAHLDLNARSTASEPRSGSRVPRGRRPGLIVHGTRQRFVAATGLLDTGLPVVSVMGDVDVATAPALEQTLLDVESDATREVVVDLTGCSFLDSRGLEALTAMSERLERSDRSLALVLSNPSLMRIFKITHVEESFEIYPSLSALRGSRGGVVRIASERQLNRLEASG